MWLVSRQCARLARRRAGWLAALAALALGALAAGARVLAPARVSAVHEFPRVRAADLAHLLADLSAHTLTTPGSWKLEEESGNYTVWRYAVSYACGVRCAGRAAVEAQRAGDAGERHGAARAHRVLVRRAHCLHPPLLPWPTVCEEMETEWVITSVGSGAAEGARLQQTVRARCGAAAALLARCAGERDLRAAADRALQRVRQLLH